MSIKALPDYRRKTIRLVSGGGGVTMNIWLTPEEAVELQNQITCALQNIGVLDVPGN